MSGPYNLHSPTTIQSQCTIGDLDTWLESEVSVLDAEERAIINPLIPNILKMVRFAEFGHLLWPGCDRVPEPGARQRIHRYVEPLKSELKAKGIEMDTRSNGPAIAAFLYAGGERPGRVGSRNSWSIHHLYSGKFPYIGRTGTLHAVKHGDHFTNSAGLIAAHPVLDAMSDEYPCIAWYLRARAFERFGYDPDQVFNP
jgi:hypothetical protein